VLSDLKLKNHEGHPFGHRVEQLRKSSPTRKFHSMWKCEEVSELKISHLIYLYHLIYVDANFLHPAPFWVLCMLWSGRNLFQILADPFFFFTFFIMIPCWWLGSAQNQSRFSSSIWVVVEHKQHACVQFYISFPLGKRDHIELASKWTCCICPASFYLHII
jgi:hypothetical protein